MRIAPALAAALLVVAAGQGGASAAEPPPHHEHVPPAEDPAPSSPADRAACYLPPPRLGRTLGVGLGVGYDGLVSLSVGWMSEGGVSAEVAVGLVYPVVDARVRWYGVEHALTPVVGLGMLTSFGHEDRLGVDVADLDRLYDLGELVHVDLGLAWTITREVEVFAGVAFTTSLNRDHVDAVTFFPVATSQVSYWF